VYVSGAIDELLRARGFEFCLKTLPPFSSVEEAKEDFEFVG
jgi:hypothetical protein